MTRIRAALAGLLAAVLLAAAHPALAEEAILDYRQTVRVEQDGTLLVDETITVRAERNQIRRGIYRDFPTVFVDDDGGRHQVGFDLVSVRRDGADEPYTVNRNGGGVRIYIGAEDVLLPSGRYTYELSYETTRQIRRLPDQDQLFWNVTGNDWAFPILSAEVRIDLPPGVEPIDDTAYTGGFGQRGSDWSRFSVGDDIGFRTTRPLWPGEGLSVVVGMPKGSIAAPTRIDELRYLFLDHGGTIVGLAGLALVLGYYLVAWKRVGRDPPKGTIIPLFAPPDGVSAPLAQYIHERGLSGQGWTAMSAGWISLAVKGLATLDNTGKNLRITAVKPAPSATPLPKSERALMDWLTARGGDVTINRKVGPTVGTLRTRFVEAVQGESRETFFHNNTAYAVLGIVLSVAAIGLAIFFSLDGVEELASLMPLVFVVAFGTVAFNGVRRLATADDIPSRIGGLILSLVGLGGALVGLAASGGIMLATGASWLFPAVAAVLAIVNVLFLNLLAAPTVNGRKMMDRIEGLILYMTVAEEKRLNMPGLPPVTPAQYETLLPYAVALGVEKRWTAALERYLATAGAAVAAASAYHPSWYHGSLDRPMAFASDLGSVSRSFQSSVPPPKSSSSGFSGSSGSGGGGGGGGGGGW